MIFFFFFFFFVHIKMTTNYYQKYKERCWKETLEKYQNLSEEKKNERQQKGKRKIQDLTGEEKEKRYNKYLSEEQMQKLIECKRNHYLRHNKITIGRLSRFFKDPETITFISWISPRNINKFWNLLWVWRFFNIKVFLNFCF